MTGSHCSAPRWARATRARHIEGDLAGLSRIEPGRAASSLVEPGRACLNKVETGCAERVRVGLRRGFPGVVNGSGAHRSPATLVALSDDGTRVCLRPETASTLLTGNLSIASRADAFQQTRLTWDYLPRSEDSPHMTQLLP